MSNRNYIHFLTITTSEAAIHSMQAKIIFQKSDIY